MAKREAANVKCGKWKVDEITAQPSGKWHSSASAFVCACLIYSPTEFCLHIYPVISKWLENGAFSAANFFKFAHLACLSPHIQHFGFLSALVTKFMATIWQIYAQLQRPRPRARYGPLTGAKGAWVISNFLYFCCHSFYPAIDRCVWVCVCVSER